MGGKGAASTNCSSSASPALHPWTRPPCSCKLGPLACLGARWSPRVFTLTETSEGCDDLLTQELFCAPCQKLISGGGGILLKRFGELLKTTGWGLPWQTPLKREERKKKKLKGQRPQSSFFRRIQESGSAWAEPACITFLVKKKIHERNGSELSQSSVNTSWCCVCSDQTVSSLFGAGGGGVVTLQVGSTCCS